MPKATGYCQQFSRSVAIRSKMKSRRWSVASQLSARSRVRITRKFLPTARLDAASYPVPVVPRIDVLAAQCGRRTELSLRTRQLFSFGHRWSISTAMLWRIRSSGRPRSAPCRFYLHPCLPIRRSLVLSLPCSRIFRAVLSTANAYSETEFLQ